jgi:Cu-Zn family superoxide dismutase
MKPKQLIYIFCFLFFLTACKKDPKKESLNDTEIETEVSIDHTATNKPKKETYEMRKVRLELMPLNGAAVDIKSVFSDQAGSVAVMGSVKAAPNTTYTAEIMEFKSNNSSDFSTSNLKKWNPESGMLESVNTDENGKAIFNHKTSDWCLSCDDQTRNINGKVLVVSEGEGSGSKIVAVKIIE